MQMGVCPNNPHRLSLRGAVAVSVLLCAGIANAHGGWGWGDWRDGHHHGSMSSSSSSSSSSSTGGTQICHSIDFDVGADGVPVIGGTTLSDQWRSLGLTIQCEENGWFHNHGSSCIALDTSNPPSGLADLGTPNEDFGGPGIGRSGEQGRLGENADPLGMVLVRAARRAGHRHFNSVVSDLPGRVRLIFSAPVTQAALQLLDVEKFNNLRVELKDVPSSRKWTRVNGLGNNSVQFVDLPDNPTREIVLHYSGHIAVAQLDFCTSCTQETDAQLCTANAAQCGPLVVQDSCGITRTIDCGGCAFPFECGLSQPNVCSYPDDVGNGSALYLVSSAIADPSVGGQNGGFAVQIPGFHDGDASHAVQFQPEDTYVFVDYAAGDGFLSGRVLVSDVGAGSGIVGEEWYLTVPLRFRGRGTAGEGGAGPLLELSPGQQPTSATDQWRYFDFAEATLQGPSTGEAVLTLGSAGTYPLQIGFAASGKNRGLGASAIFTFVKTDRDAVRIEGTGRFAFDLKRVF